MDESRRTFPLSQQTLDPFGHQYKDRIEIGWREIGLQATPATSVWRITEISPELAIRHTQDGGERGSTPETLQDLRAEMITQRSPLPKPSAMTPNGAFFELDSPANLEKKPANQAGGGGRESNPPATILAAKPVLKTGGATGPLPPPALFIRYLQRSTQSRARQSAHLLPTIFDFG
jgi:hypothetical protein